MCSDVARCQKSAAVLRAEHRGCGRSAAHMSCRGGVLQRRPAPPAQPCGEGDLFLDREPRYLSLCIAHTTHEICGQKALRGLNLQRIALRSLIAIAAPVAQTTQTAHVAAGSRVDARAAESEGAEVGPLLPMIVLFIVLARNKLRIPLEGTYSREM